MILPQQMTDREKDWKYFCSLHDISEDYAQCSFDKCKELDPRIVDYGQQWVLNPNTSILMQGACGTGKTYFMLCLIRCLLMQYPLSCIYYSKSKYLDDRITTDFKEYGSCKYFIDNLSTEKFVFIDDFGVEKCSEKSEREYIEFIDRRVANKRPIIINSNLTFDEIKKNMGARIHSRLKVCIFLPFTGKDLRKTYHG